MSESNLYRKKKNGIGGFLEQGASLLQNPMVATAIGLTTGIPPGVVMAGGKMAGGAVSKKKKTDPTPQAAQAEPTSKKESETEEPTAEGEQMPPEPAEVTEVTEDEEREYDVERLCDEINDEMILREFQPGRKPRSVAPKISAIKNAVIDAEIADYTDILAVMAVEAEMADDEDDELDDILGE